MKGFLSDLYYGFPELRSLMFLIPPLYWFRREIAKVFVDQIMKIRPKTLLEVGFSDAFLTKRISLSLPDSKIFAIDTSLNGVERAKKLGLKNVVFLCKDFFETEGHYDLTVSMHVFVLFDHRRALRKLKEISKISIISLTGVSLFTSYHRPFHRFFTGMDVNIVEPEDYARIAEDEGFKVEIIKVNHIERSYVVILEVK